MTTDHDDVDGSTSGRCATIYDVARACGVAASTVSRAFSRPGRVSAATAQRVHEAAARLGYRGVPLARVVATARTSLIALAVSDVTNPVYFAMIRGAEAAAAASGRHVLVHDTQESARLERELLDRSMAMFDGVVLAGSRLPDSAVRHLAQRAPLVVLNRAVTGVPSVVADNPRGVRRAMEHLGELGHRQVTYLAGPEASWPDGTRWRAVQEGGVELEMGVRRLGPFPPTVTGGIAAARMLCHRPPTAVIAYNDLLALGLMRGLAAAGVDVPGEISVVGFDNIFGADFAGPALTTVAFPLRALGEEAVARLLHQVDGVGAAPARAAVLPAQLVVRESTARPRPAQRRRKSTSPAEGTTSVSGSASSAARSTSAGSR